MGRYLHVLMPWKAQSQKFILKVSPGIPQSPYDEKIFYPNWELRPEFKWSRGKVRLWEGADIYSSKKWYKFTNRHNPAEKYDEYHLAWDRGVYFEETGRQNGHRSYRRRSNPTGNVTVPIM